MELIVNKWYVRTLVIVAVFATFIGISAASASSAGACHYTPAMLQSWKDGWARQLPINDPKHAEQLTRVTSEIIDGQLDALRLDITNGLSPNANVRGAGGDTSLLELAVAACQDKIARQLVLSGASANGDDSSTPLVVAAAKGEGDLAEFLIQYGATVDKIDFNGHTALEDAVRQRQLTAVKVLLAHGANVNRLIGGNATILDLVARSADPDGLAIANELRSHGAVARFATDKPE
jgi:ankyrin repeat protein